MVIKRDTGGGGNSAFLLVLHVQLIFITIIQSQLKNLFFPFVKQSECVIMSTQSRALTEDIFIRTCTLDPLQLFLFNQFHLH